MCLTEFQEEALTKFTEEITDQFFCFIENDRNLMWKYLKVVGEKGRDPVNQALGAAVKEWLNLENLKRCDAPKSKLIKTYTKHKRLVR